MAKYLFFKGETLYYSCLARVMWEGAETLKDNILLALTILLFTKNFDSAVFVFQSDVQTILMTKNYTHTHIFGPATVSVQYNYHCITFEIKYPDVLLSHRHKQRTTAIDLCKSSQGWWRINTVCSEILYSKLSRHDFKQKLQRGILLLRTKPGFLTSPLRAFRLNQYFGDF